MNQIIEQISEIKRVVVENQNFLDPLNNLDEVERATGFIDTAEKIHEKSERFNTLAQNFFSRLNFNLQSKSAERNQALRLKVKDLTNTPTINGVQIVDFSDVEPEELQPPFALEKGMARVVHISREKGEMVDAIHGELQFGIGNFIDPLGEADHEADPEERAKTTVLELRQKAIMENKDLADEALNLEVRAPHIEIPENDIPIPDAVQNFNFEITDDLHCDVLEMLALNVSIYGYIVDFSTSLTQRLLVLTLLHIVKLEPGAVYDAIIHCTENVPFFEDANHYVPSLKGLLGGFLDQGPYFFSTMELDFKFSDPGLIQNQIVDHFRNLFVQLPGNEQLSGFFHFFSDQVTTSGFLSYDLFPMALPILCTLKALAYSYTPIPLQVFCEPFMAVSQMLPQELAAIVYQQYAALPVPVCPTIIVPPEMLESIRQGIFTVLPQPLQEIGPILVNLYGNSIFQSDQVIIPENAWFTPESLLNIRRFIYLSLTWFPISITAV